MRLIRGLLALLIVLVVGLGAWIFSGAYDIAADAPHWRGTTEVLEQLRERSIAARAPSLSSVPNLDDAALIAKGATHYAEMCTGCHLAPGMTDTELRQGLYPIAPKLAEIPSRSPAQQFWIIKHGIKFTAMPAWGLTHDDGIVWAIVAFVQKLPKMSPEEYQNAVGAPKANEPEHVHGGEDSDDEAPADQQRTRKEPKKEPDAEGMFV
jgi:mono/diheme cytochrome c family protein